MSRKGRRNTGNKEQDWHQDQVAQFKAIQSTYKELAETWGKILAAAAKRNSPGAIVQYREKEISSFAEKILRKRTKYEDPLHQLTDLAGARIVTYSQQEVSRLCHFIENDPGIEVDWENSLDVASRLRTSEFGYRAIHYVVSLTGEPVLGIAVGRAAIVGLKAELQVCTMLQHVWAAIGHDRLYKGAIDPPASLRRELGAIAGLLEIADARFGNAIGDIDALIESFDAYKSATETEEAIRRWTAVYNADPRDDRAARALGRLYASQRRWVDARKWFELIRAKDSSPVLTDLGRAEWRSDNVPKGRMHLKQATVLDPSNALAHAELGCSYLRQSANFALPHFEKALACAPEEPTVLVPYLECQLRVSASTSVLFPMAGSLRRGIEECMRRSEHKVALPDVLFQRGRLELYRAHERAFEALAAYAEAMSRAESGDAIREEFTALNRIVKALGGGRTVLADSDGARFEWARRLHLLGRVAREEMSGAMGSRRRTLSKWATGRLTGIASVHAGKGRRAPQPPVTLRQPIVIVAGGCDEELDADLRTRYGELFQRAFYDFRGTIICGGTTAGISGLVGDLEFESPGKVRRIAYLPSKLPDEDRVHPAYEIVPTSETKYTPAGPMQTWADILLAGFDPAWIRVVGVSGGDLSAFEYRLALALGAKVGIIERSGREASSLLSASIWMRHKGLAPLPPDWATLAAFLEAASPELLWPRKGEVDPMARRFHERFRHEALKDPKKIKPALLPWECLPEIFRDSNRLQAAHSVLILRSVGFDVVRAQGKVDPKRAAPRGYDRVIDLMAEREHGRYNAERLASGWRWGEKNDADALTNPTLVSWERLPLGDRGWDRNAMSELPAILAEAGYRIVKRRT